MHLLRVLYLAALILIVFSPVAMSDVGGSIELGYGHYESKVEGVEESDMSHFAQKYDLYLSRKGQLMGGRAGAYDLMLGGEWVAVNSDIMVNGVANDYNVSTGKLLYRGEVTFSPGGLPFRFNAYARDIKESQFEDAGFSSSWMEENYLSPVSRQLLDPNIIYDISDGTHFEMGASMTIGIKNGSYLGNYRNILSHLPKLYVDYRETRVTDYNSRTPEDYVDRELAFVSLNKKHNWFHYRFYDHTDNFNPFLSFEEQSYLLGTVDQNMRREWINLTNWIQLSVDAGFTSENNPLLNIDSENRYSLNLLAKTERRNWTSSVFSRFWRWDRFNELQRFAQVPIYAAGTPDRNNSWRFRFVGSAEKRNIPFALVNLERDVDTLYSKGRWETNRIQKYIVASELEGEKKFGDEGEGWAARSTVEYFTNRDRRLDLNSFSSLSLAYFSGIPTGSLSGIPSSPVSETDLLELVGRFNVDKQINPRFRTGIESMLLLGTGQAESDVTDYIRPLSRTGFFASANLDNTAVVIDGTVWRGRLMWFADQVLVSRASNRYELAAEYQDDGTSGAGQYLARHHYRYNATPYRVDVLSEALYGEDLSRSVNSHAFGVVLGGTIFDGYSLSNQSRVDYAPNRNHSAGGTLWVDYRDSETAGSGYRLALRQDYGYTQYVSAGVVRRLFELNEFADYERFSPEMGQFFEAVALTCVGNYYPVSWTRLGAKVRWQHDIERSFDDIGYGLYTDFNFSQLNVGLEYEYGMRTVDDTGALLGRTEQRWNVSIRKTF